MPLAEIDVAAGADMMDFAALGGTLLRGVDGLAFEHAYVLLFVAHELVVDGEVAQGAAAQIAREKAARSRLGSTQISAIEAHRFMVG